MNRYATGHVADALAQSKTAHCSHCVADVASWVNIVLFTVWSICTGHVVVRVAKANATSD